MTERIQPRIAIWDVHVECLSLFETCEFMLSKGEEIVVDKLNKVCREQSNGGVGLRPDLAHEEVGEMTSMRPIATDREGAAVIVLGFLWKSISMYHKRLYVFEIR